MSSWANWAMSGSKELSHKPTLNLGCGPDPWGDVRIDIQNWNGNATMVMDFDALPLPFPYKFFSECLINHVLEHSRNPSRLLHEAIRVSDLIHAKYPYKYDRVPYVLKGLLTLNPRLAYLDSKAQVRDRLTRVGLIKTLSPDTHLWTVGPFGRYQVNEFDLFPLKEWINNESSSRKQVGRKIKRIIKSWAKFWPKVGIGCEWECWYP